MKKRVGTIIILAVVVLLVAVGIRQVLKSKAELPKSITDLQDELGVPVEVAKVELGTFTLTRTYLGTVEGALQNDVVANISEDIVEIPVKVGDRVKQNQILCRLDTRASMVQYNQLKLAYEDAKQDAERMENLYQTGAVSKQMLEKAQLARDIARENLKTSSEVVALTAPFEGIVTEVFYRVGETTETGEPVVRIANLSRVKIKFTVNFDDWKKVHENSPVVLWVNGNGEVEIPAKIAEISISADPHTRLFSIWVEAENGDGLLQPGLLVDVQITTIRKENAVLIPRDAAIVRNEVMGVFVVNNGNHAVFKPFTAGFSNVTSIEVAEGLDPGQTVVVYGHNNLEDGQPVNITDS